MQRIRVLLPQPDGPMMAVTRFGSTDMVTFSMASFCPYQAESSSISTLLPSNLTSSGAILFSTGSGLRFNAVISYLTALERRG
jgi:hypothetical protein